MRLDIGTKGGLRRSQLVTAILELVGASKQVFFVWRELPRPIRLIKPDYPYRPCRVPHYALGDREVFTPRLSGSEGVNLPFYHHFAWAHLAYRARRCVIIIVSRQIIEKIPHRPNAGLLQCRGRLWPDAP